MALHGSSIKCDGMSDVLYIGCDLGFLLHDKQIDNGIVALFHWKAPILLCFPIPFFSLQVSGRAIFVLED